MKLETSYLLRASAGRLWLAILGVLAGPLLIGASAGAERSLGGWAALAGVAASVAVMIVSAVAFTRALRPKRGHVTVSDAEVSFDGASVPREAIKAAHFAPAVGASPPTVRLIGAKEREIAWIGVRDAASGDALLAKLGLDPSKTTARFFALARLRSFAGLAMLGALGLTAALMVLGAVFDLPALAVLAIAPLVAGSAYLLPAQIQVAADGLLYKTRVAPRFFAWADVDRVETYGRGIKLRLRSGEIVAMPMTQRAGMYYDYEKVAQAALYARAASALAKFRGEDVPDVSARVARRGSTKEEWTARLFDREGSFRQAPLRSDDLWSVLESPAASHTARAGAAAVLAREAGEADRVRLRVAAEACVEPRVRVVLDKAAGGAPEEELLSALDEVDDDAERAAS